MIRKDRLLSMAEYLHELANQMDDWAEESRIGGWSTHQVAAQRELANQIRRREAEFRREIDL